MIPREILKRIRQIEICANRIVKSKPILCVALVLSGVFCSRIAAQNIFETNKWHGFPILPPITNANSSIRLPLLVHVPTKLRIERTNDTLSVKIDNESSLRATNLMVGLNMVTGAQAELFVYPVGELRPTNEVRGMLGSGLDFNLGTAILSTNLDGIPHKGKSYVVEMDVAVFETDIPSQHMWMPRGRNYKVLWQQTLKQIVK